MIFVTQGILLKRELFKEYNEKLLFYTKDLGKISVFAFGTQSVNSLRGKILGGFGWLTLKLEKNKNRYVLRELSPINTKVVNKKNNDNSFSHWSNKDFVLDFSRLLGELIPKIPLNVATPEIYHILRLLTDKEIAEYPRTFRLYCFYHSLLCEMGIMPDWSSCNNCKKYCSEWYNFSPPGQITGTTCPQSYESSNFSNSSAISSKNKSKSPDFLQHLNQSKQERLGVEDIYFIHYTTTRYQPELNFFNTTLKLLKQFSQTKIDTKENNKKIDKNTEENMQFNLHWWDIIAVLKKIFIYEV